MKKKATPKMNLKGITGIFIILFAMLSCEEQDHDYDFDGFENPVAQSTQTVEDNKRIIEDAAIDLASRLNSIARLPVFETMLNLKTLLDSAPPESFKKSANTHALPILSESEKEYIGHTAGIISRYTITGDKEFESLQNTYADLKGKYSWNETAGSWDKSADVDSLVFVFPSKRSASSNNAVFSLSYSSLSGSNRIVEEYYEGDLPRTLHILLKVDNTNRLRYDLQIDYFSEVPKKVDGRLLLPGVESKFTFSDAGDATDTTKITIKQDGKTIISMGMILNGNFTSGHIDKNIYVTEEDTSYYDFRYNENTGKWERVLVSDTITSNHADLYNILFDARAYMQLMNIKLFADCTADTLMKEYDRLFANQDAAGFDEQGAINGFSESINAHCRMYVSHLEENTIIAGLSAFPNSETINYRIYNTETNQYKDTTEINHYIDYKLAFSDTSSVAVGTYFKEDFGALKSQLNAFIDDFNEKYEGYHVKLPRINL